MTTPAQNQWAQYLESATQQEIIQMAEYAIDHIESSDQVADLHVYFMQHLRTMPPHTNRKGKANGPHSLSR